MNKIYLTTLKHAGMKRISCIVSILMNFLHIFLALLHFKKDMKFWYGIAKPTSSL